MKRIRLSSYALSGSAGLLLLFLVGMLYRVDLAPRAYQVQTQVTAQAHPVQTAAMPAPLHQLVTGPVTEAPGPPSIRRRYTFANDLPDATHKRVYLTVTDKQTGETTRLGDDTGGAAMRGWGEDQLFWDFNCGLQCSTYQTGLYAYSFASKENIFVGSRSSRIHPEQGGEWVAHVVQKEQVGENLYDSQLYATNLRTQETITLTTHAPLHEYFETFAISPWLAVWSAYPPASAPREERLAIYDLVARTVITTINPRLGMGDDQSHISQVGAGQSVVTWNTRYGYDLVTGSYFTITRGALNLAIDRFVAITPVTEANRILSWTVRLTDEDRHFQAPLLDATPSTAPCIEGQNLVQNGNLEDIAAHNLWQQSGSPSDLIVNDLPPNAPQAGQWAIRLGRYSNSQQTIQQTLNIPSNVKRITLAFDVRASSWDIWGGDQLQVDLIDPLTNQSVLAAPVTWTNRQLANGGWLPLQVDIQDWPGIDTPLQLVFRATTDWAFPTDFTLDNLRFLTACH